MTDITLDEIRSGYNLSKINGNFEDIEDVINNEILHTTGGNNTMGQSLDMDSNRILNLPEPTSDSEPLRVGDLDRYHGKFLYTGYTYLGDFDEDATYEDVSGVVTQNGINFSPKPERLPIAAGAFNPDDWVLAQIDSVYTVDSVAALIAGSFAQDQIYVRNYTSGWAATATGPQGGFLCHSTGGTNASPTVGTAVSAGSIGGSGSGDYTGQVEQAGYFWDALGNEYKLQVEDGFVTNLAFGLVGDNTTVNTDTMKNLNQFIWAENCSVRWIKGKYVSAEPFHVRGVGVRAIGSGDVEIKQVSGGNGITLMVGDADLRNTTITLESQSRAITADMNTGSVIAYLSDTSGYSVGDWVLMFSGTSLSSSGTNRIPTRKQWFRIRVVTAGTIQFHQKSDYDFTTADAAAVFSPDKQFAIDCRIEGITFSNDNTHTGSYGHFISGAKNTIIKNVEMSFYSALGPCTFIDQVVYEDVDAYGYNGYSVARGTKKVSFIRAHFRPRYTGPQNVCTFFEETPEKIMMDDCTLVGAFTLTAVADNPSFGLDVSLKNCRIKSDGVAILAKGYSGGDGYVFNVDRCHIDAPGGVGATGRQTVITMQAFDSVRITNTTFANADVTAYAVDGVSFGALYTRYSGNQYGDSLGIHPALDSAWVVDDRDGVWEIGSQSNRAGSITTNKLVIPRNDTALTVTSNEVTATHSNHTVDTSSSAQVINTINGGESGMMLIIGPASSSNPLTLTDATGNLRLPATRVLNHADDRVALVYDGTVWKALSFSDNS